MISDALKHLPFAFKRITLFLSLFASSALAQQLIEWERGPSRVDDLTFEVYVFGPGPSPEEWWGHIGLQVKDSRRKTELMYNWGMFTFDEKFMLNFVTGTLRFWVDAEPTPPSMAFYRRQGRHIESVTLNLSTEQKIRLVALISENMRPENREYTYEYFRDNCSTRIRDLIDIVTEGSISKRAKSSTGVHTYRDHVNRVTYNNLGMNLLLSFLLGPIVDAPPTRWTDMFLPGELIRYLSQSEVPPGKQDAPLITGMRILEKGRIQENTKIIKYFPWDLISGVVFGLTAWSLAILSVTLLPFARSLLSVMNVSLALILGIPGTILLYFCTLTQHTYTYWNQNIIFANPITLALAGVAIWSFTKNSNAARWNFRIHALFSALCAIAIIIKILPFSSQDNWVFIRFCFPAFILSTAAWWKICKTHREIKL
jgi:hypothetical protein